MQSAAAGMRRLCKKWRVPLSPASPLVGVQKGRRAPWAGVSKGRQAPWAGLIRGDSPLYNVLCVERKITYPCVGGSNLSPPTCTSWTGSARRARCGRRCTCAEQRASACTTATSAPSTTGGATTTCAKQSESATTSMHTTKKPKCIPPPMAGTFFLDRRQGNQTPSHNGEGGGGSAPEWGRASMPATRR